MSEQQKSEIQFYISAFSPCPYLQNKEERKLFTHLSGHKAVLNMQALSEHGFRRSQNILYRPSCKDCSMCKSCRVRVEDYKASKNQRRVFNKNKNIISTQLECHVSDEHFDLFTRYLKARHNDGGMVDMNMAEFEDMMVDSPVNSAMVEYRLMQNDGKSGKLIAVALIDILFDGISLVYSFFDPNLGANSLGTFMVIDNIYRAKEKKLKYVYLGYWVKGSKKMSYKADFKPLEFYDDGNDWIELNKK